MNIDKDEVHIWKYSINEKDYEAEAETPILSFQEKERCEAYIKDAEKMRYISVHRFVRQVLAKYIGKAPEDLQFSHAPMGKPYIEGTSIFFNYSYRANTAIMAISGLCDVGVDIEKMKELQDAKTFCAFSFSENERKIIFQNGGKMDADALFTFWSFKEAIIKALGVGLNADLTQIDLSSFFYKEVNPLDFDKKNIYTLKRLLSESGYKSAVAIRGAAFTFKEFNFIN